MDVNSHFGTLRYSLDMYILLFTYVAQIKLVLKGLKFIAPINCLHKLFDHSRPKCFVC